MWLTPIKEAVRAAVAGFALGFAAGFVNGEGWAAALAFGGVLAAVAATGAETSYGFALALAHLNTRNYPTDEGPELDHHEVPELASPYAPPHL